nr:MAG TPA: hypothetical protein [Bacteriophage sp.]
MSYNSFIYNGFSQVIEFSDNLNNFVLLILKS